MISIDVELLTGRYVAARYDDRATAEWPPEPARLYSACVETLHHHPELDSEAREALEWLETLPPPSIVASQANARTVCNVFVPVNDAQIAGGWENAFDRLTAAETEADSASDAKAAARAEKKVAKAREKLHDAVSRATADDGKRAKDTVAAAAAELPERRVRQPRTFPSIRPESPRVSFVWQCADPTDAVREALDSLVSRIVRLGHSSSLVACRVGDGSLARERPEDIWSPDPHGSTPLRVVTAGQLRRLEVAFERHRGTEPRVLPCTFQPYRRGPAVGTSPKPPQSVFGQDWVVFRTVPADRGARPPRFRLTRGPDLARALRGALLKHAEEPAPEVLSGHDATGEPLTRPHAAYVPLADVGSQWASGGILGVAVVLPRELGKDERSAIFRAIGRFEASAQEEPCSLWMGRAGSVAVERVVDRDPRTTLHASTWSRSAQRWASVTAVALDRNPGDLRSEDPVKAGAAEAEAQSIVALACTRLGLPEPEWVQIMRRSVFDASPKAEAFMPFPRERQAIRRVCVHVEVAFPRPVEGPVVLGAGRYFGLGLCRPLPRGTS